ncbi:cytochrome-c peroxidase [Acidisoma sp. C75]
MRGILLGLAGAAGIALAAATLLVLGSPVGLSTWLADPAQALTLSEGFNPQPVALRRPTARPLSAMALLGRAVFFDAQLSASGRLSCASCHDPARAYGPPSGLSAVYGGPHLERQGVRAVPSLMYLERQPNFSIGPDNEENEAVSLTQLAAAGKDAARARKTAATTAAAAANLVPQGGLFWDGRADRLQQQALIPLLSPFEMDGGSIAAVAAKLAAAPYAGQMRMLFGDTIFDDPAMAVSEAMFAVARYQIEDTAFHPFTSKFDFWLEGKARMSTAELRGYLLFNDPARADCAGCHLDRPTADGRPPLFTDFQYEALGVPRNPALHANADPHYFDLGLCGPYRTDLRADTQYCGLFLTPTLRNAATRHVFFHNGVYHSLDQVLDFYDFRDVDPGRIYPRRADGKVAVFNDLPRRYRANVDRVDPPLNRHPGEPPAMSAADRRDIIAFLKTLTDGYRPPPGR